MPSVAVGYTGNLNRIGQDGCAMHKSIGTVTIIESTDSENTCTRGHSFGVNHI